MLSPSGKVEWLCPECHGEDIHQDFPEQDKRYCRMAWCNDCGWYFPWRARIKLGKKQRLLKLITGETPNGA